jgi:hypothetical protein
LKTKKLLYSYKCASRKDVQINLYLLKFFITSRNILYLLQGEKGNIWYGGEGGCIGWAKIIATWYL